MSARRPTGRPPGSGRGRAFAAGAPARLPARRLAPAAASGALAAACGIGLLATSGWLITRASERPPIFALAVAIGAVQAFALGRGVARYLERLRVHGLSLEVLGGLRLRLYEILEPLVPGALKGSGSGATLSGFVADTELVAEGVAKGVGAAIDVLASVAVGAAIAFLVEPGLGLALLAGAAAVVLTAVASSRLDRPGAEAEATARAELAEAVVDTMGAARELIAYGREDLLEQRLAEVQRRARAAAWRRSLGAGLGRALVTLLAGGTVVAVSVVGLAAADAHRLSGVPLAVVVLVALAALDQLIALPAVLADVGAARAAAARLDRLARIPPLVGEPSVARTPGLRPVTTALVEVDVVLDGATVLDGVSLEAAAGRRLALVGRSGSGKTTAIQALLHFVPCAGGRALLGGLDVSEMSREGIARHVGWVSEDTHVFAASLADNLRLARPGAGDAELEGVLARVGLSGWYELLPDGLATALGAGGRPVSAGERQRLGMARALLAGGTVLLLDEPTAHIDPASSDQLLAELLGAVRGRTVLVAGHEPDIARHVDEVITLDAGRVVDRSPAAERCR